MSILSWSLVGLIVGWLAGSMVMTGSGYGTIGDIFSGIVGAILGGFLITSLFGMLGAANEFSLVSIFVAFLGAVITISILRTFTPGRHI